MILPAMTPAQAALAADSAIRGEDRHILEAKLCGNIDALYAIGGADACLHMFPVLIERVAERMRRDAAEPRG